MSSTKKRAALERAEAERQRRVDEKVERGEAVRVPLMVIGGVSSSGVLDVEAARARKLAELQKGGEKREVIFDPIEVIFTGVPRPAERNDDPESVSVSVRTTESLRDELPQRTAPMPESGPPESKPRYVRIQVRPGNGAGDADEIAEGEFTVRGNRLRL